MDTEPADGWYVTEGYVKKTHPKECRWCLSQLVIHIQARVCLTCDTPPKEKKKRG